MRLTKWSFLEKTSYVFGNHTYAGKRNRIELGARRSVGPLGCCGLTIIKMRKGTGMGERERCGRRQMPLQDRPSKLLRHPRR